MNKYVTDPLQRNIENLKKSDKERRQSRTNYYRDKVKKPAPKPEIRIIRTGRD